MITKQDLEDLNKAETPKQYFETLNKIFDLDCKLNNFSKGLLNVGVGKLLSALNIKRRY